MIMRKRRNRRLKMRSARSPRKFYRTSRREHPANYSARGGKTF